MLKRFAVTFIFALVFTVMAVVNTAAQADTVLVLPFENTSGKPEFNWVGESFADSLADLLRIPNLNVISN